jgi:hypothetical protein
MYYKIYAKDKISHDCKNIELLLSTLFHNKINNKCSLKEQKF